MKMVIRLNDEEAAMVRRGLFAHWGENCAQDAAAINQRAKRVLLAAAGAFELRRLRHYGFVFEVRDETEDESIARQVLDVVCDPAQQR